MTLRHNETNKAVNLPGHFMVGMQGLMAAAFLARFPETRVDSQDGSISF